MDGHGHGKQGQSREYASSFFAVSSTLQFTTGSFMIAFACIDTFCTGSRSRFMSWQVPCP